MIRNFLYISIIIVFTISCLNNSNEDKIKLQGDDLNHKELTTNISFTREISYGNTTDEVLVSRVGDFVVDNNNRLFISDIPQFKVHIFNQNGNYLASIGREGDGPGEFRSINRLLLHSDQLYVYDVSVRRFQIFSLHELTNSNTVLLQPQNKHEYDLLRQTYPEMPISIRNDGSFLVEYLQIRNPFWEPDDPAFDGFNAYFVLDKNGRKILSNIFEQWFSYILSGESLIPSVPFDNKPLLSVTNNDSIYTAYSNEFLIKVHDPMGNYIRSISHPFVNKTLTLEDALATTHERRHNAIRSRSLPNIWPALDEMLIDDENRLWVSTIVEDFEVYEWWVLEDTGELITKFEWPRDEPIEVVKNGYMYTRETEEETGLQQIVRYRIELEQGESRF